MNSRKFEDTEEDMPLEVARDDFDRTQKSGRTDVVSAMDQVRRSAKPNDSNGFYSQRA